jgi:hypothetical protein
MTVSAMTVSVPVIIDCPFLFTIPDDRARLYWKDP